MWTKQNRLVRAWDSKNMKTGTVIASTGVSIAGSTTGALIGTFALPVPVVGSLVGGVIGGFVGGLLGAFGGVMISSEINHYNPHGVGEGIYSTLNAKIVKKENQTRGGFGLFANEDIFKGETIWVDLDKKVYQTVSMHDLESWPKEKLDAFSPWSHQVGLYDVKGPNLDAGFTHEDNASFFMNHSCDPTAWYTKPNLMVARRNIKAGEEITYDYITSEGGKTHITETCDCGSQICRGKVDPGDVLNKDLQERYKGHFLPHVREAIEMFAKMQAAFESMSSGQDGFSFEDNGTSNEPITEIYPSSFYHGYLTENTPELLDDADFVYPEVIRTVYAWAVISDRLKSDKDFILRVCAENWSIASQLNEEVLKDTEFVRKLVVENPWCYQHVKSVHDDESITEAVVEKDGSQLSYASDRLKDNETIVRKAVTNRGSALEFVSDRLKDNLEIVMISVASPGWGFSYAPEKFRNDKSVVLKVVAVSGNSLEYASPELRADREICLAALKQDPNALMYCSDEVRDDDEVVLEAIKRSYYAFDHASPAIKKDKEICLEAIAINAGVLDYVDPELKKDKDIVMAAVKKDPRTIEYADPSIKDDDDIIEAVLSQDGLSLEHLSDKVKNDKELVMIAVKRDSYAIEYASEELKGDKELGLIAVAQDGYRLAQLADTLKDDPEVVEVALQGTSDALQFASERLRNDPDTVRIALIQSGSALEHASEEIREDKDMCLLALTTSGTALQWCSETNRDDLEVVLAAIGNDKDAFQYASDRLKQDQEVLEACN